jgi:two-component system chemotaxis response regulator CheY
LNPSNPLTILLAEDERSVAFSISFALSGDGHKIEIVTDGEQALAKLIAEPGAFDLLITDNNMPQMTGIELVKRLGDSLFPGKIMVLSAHLSSENRAAYEALGVDAMMSKPFDVHHLRAVVSRIALGDLPLVVTDPNAFQLSRDDVLNLLKLGLSAPE